jgi:hypothetical protein
MSQKPRNKAVTDADRQTEALEGHGQRRTPRGSVTFRVNLEMVSTLTATARNGTPTQPE